MPKENKKRGRREEKKRKWNDEHHEVSPKRQRVLSEDHAMHDVDDGEIEVHGDAGDDFISFGVDSSHPPPDTQQNQFYGLLEPEEQEYYASVNNKISANDFESDEDRAVFIQAVYRETRGKELKVASSQSCSRYLEKVILLSTADQLKSLFAAFLENLTYLVQHRFGSHCCETLFQQAAKHVDKDNGAEEDSLESLYLRAVEQLESNIGFLLTERFASHTIRVLLLVLSGEPMDDETTRSMVASKRKEKFEMHQAEEETTQRRKVPKSFQDALYSLVNALLTSIDATYLRALATHPVGNPVLQLLIKLELSASGKSKAKSGQDLLSKLLPDEELEADSESGKLIVGLMYDPTGSHLVETLVQHLPGKQFKKLYKNILKDRMRNLSKNDVASFVAIKVLERLGKDDLAEASDEIMNEIPGLVTRHRTNVIKVLFERCGVRGVDTKRLTEAVRNAYNSDEVTLLPKMLQFYASIEDLTHHVDTAGTGEEKPAPSPYKADIHGSLLVQALLRVPSAAPVIHQSILAQPPTTLVAMAKHPVASRVLQVALTSPCSPVSFRRRLVPKFYSTVTDLATHPAGSHVVDALWGGTVGLHFMKEKLAKELQSGESTIRNSNYGRTVWRNWHMDSYTRHLREWETVAKERDVNEGGEMVENRAQTQQMQDASKIAMPMQKAKATTVLDDGKTPIQRARERHALKKARAGVGNANGGDQNGTS